MGLFLRVAGPSVFLSSRHGYVRELLELYQGPFQCSRRNVEFLSRCCCGKRPHLALRGESPGFSQVAMGNLESFQSYYRGLRNPFVLPQEIPVSMRVARGLSSRCWVLGPHLQLRPGAQCSSPVLTWISGFLQSFNRGVRPHLLWRHASLQSSRAVTVVSGFLSSTHRDLWLSLEVPQGCHTCHRIVS